MERKINEELIAELAEDIEKAMHLCLFSCCDSCDFDSMPATTCECHLIARELSNKYQLKTEETKLAKEEIVKATVKEFAELIIAVSECSFCERLSQKGEKVIERISYKDIPEVVAFLAKATYDVEL